MEWMSCVCFCFSPEGTTLNQPRVERREGNERRATLGAEGVGRQNPEGVALMMCDPWQLRPPRWGFGFYRNSFPRVTRRSLSLRLFTLG